MSTSTVPQTATATWSLDPAHSSVQFKVRHMGIAWVRGEFRILNGALNWNEDKPGESAIEADIDPSSVNSSEPGRDQHLRSADFFDVEHYPVVHFQSTRISRLSGDLWSVDGVLTVRDVSKSVELLVVDVSSPTPDPWGNLRIAASASARINRKDFGLTWNTALETGGFLVGDEVQIGIDVQFIRPVS